MRRPDFGAADKRFAGQASLMYLGKSHLIERHTASWIILKYAKFIIFAIRLEQQYNEDCIVARSSVRFSHKGGYNIFWVCFMKEM